jgi:hypothetical protein
MMQLPLWLPPPSKIAVSLLPGTAPFPVPPEAVDQLVAAPQAVVLPTQ